jgi:hypothetical protein
MGFMGSVGIIKIMTHILPAPPMTHANPIDFDGMKTLLTTDHQLPRLPGSK